MGRVREHVEEAPLDGTERGHGGQVLGERRGVARGVDDARRAAAVQVGGQVASDASARRTCPT